MNKPYVYSISKPNDFGDTKLRAPHPIYRVCPSQSSTNLLSERGLEDRYVSLLLKVTVIRGLNVDGKWTRYRNNKIPKICNGK